MHDFRTAASFSLVLHAAAVAMASATPARRRLRSRRQLPSDRSQRVDITLELQIRGQWGKPSPERIELSSAGNGTLFIRAEIAAAVTRSINSTTSTAISAQRR